MKYGVTIGSKNTLTEWGLLLVNDLKIGAAAPRYKYVNVPEMSGSLDLTESLTGRVSYSSRNISFSLFGAMEEDDFEDARAELSEYAHGKRLALYLPDDNTHYFIGRISIGDKSGYHKGIIPVQMTADPYRLKASVTTVSVSGSGSVSLSNEAMPAIPTFTASASGTTVTLGTVSHTLASGVNRFDDMVLEAGSNTLTVTNFSGSLTITYQEGRL